MNHVEFLNDALSYYVQDTSRRAVSSVGMPAYQTCAYQTEDGRQCAFGRHILPGKYTTSMEGMGIDMVEEVSLAPIFPEWMGKLDMDWKCSMQNFHDRNHYWGTNQLTEEGERAFTYLLKWAEKLDKKMS